MSGDVQGGTLAILFEQLNERFTLFGEDLREIRAKTDRIPAIEDHLRTLNGSVARHEQRIEANRVAHEASAEKLHSQVVAGDEESARMIRLVAEAVDGFELRGKLEAERAAGREDVYRPMRRALLWLAKDGVVLKIGMGVGIALMTALLGLNIAR